MTEHKVCIKPVFFRMVSYFQLKKVSQNPKTTFIVLEGMQSPLFKVNLKQIKILNEVKRTH